MTQILIDLPDELGARLRARASEAGCPDLREYVRALIAADTAVPSPMQSATVSKQNFDTKPELEAMLLDGLSSGPAEEISAAAWAAKRQKLTAQFGPRGTL